ncbi:S41 family peptidase [Lederbergia panacisoli]|uniref:S41 family peptidase n=1 Tax=Lederbergia panacisoli TaxID=1255251 RepID=UPI00214B94AE|nr:S41 family peptidase [Lederbergia panacisoli]MCR2823609.1 S41 family peptidase [Lederbergia panacisoli]
MSLLFPIFICFFLVYNLTCWAKTKPLIKNALLFISLILLILHHFIDKKWLIDNGFFSETRYVFTSIWVSFYFILLVNIIFETFEYKNKKRMKSHRITSLISFTIIIFTSYLYFQINTVLPNTKIVWITENERIINYESQDWLTSFLKVNELLKKEYPFSERKQLDYDRLERIYLPKIEEAQKRNDKSGYYQTITEFLHEFKDGHVFFNGDHTLNEIYNRNAGGSFGIKLDKTINNEIIVIESSIDEIPVGSTISEWKNKPIVEALDSVSTIFSNRVPSTTTNMMYAKLNLLTRSSVGDTAKVTFTKPNNELSTITLVSANNNAATTNKPACPVEYKIFPNTAYIKIHEFIPTISCLHPEKEVEKVIRSINTKNIKTLHIDVRDNNGGYDKLTADVLGRFLKQSTFFEKIAVYDEKTNKFESAKEHVVTIEPNKVQYSGRLFIWINNSTFSSAEGFVHILKSRPNTEIVGFDETYGAFGYGQKQVLLPEGLSFTFPFGRPLDINDKILIEPDKNQVGGVLPTIKIIKTKENLLNYHHSDIRFMFSLIEDISK